MTAQELIDKNYNLLLTAFPFNNKSVLRNLARESVLIGANAVIESSFEDENLYELRTEWEQIKQDIFNENI